MGQSRCLARSRYRRLRSGGRVDQEAYRLRRVQEQLVEGHERGQPGAGMPGRAEVNSIQAAHCGRLDGPGQDPDARVQVDQVDLVQLGGQAGPAASDAVYGCH
jgi:hypothetical protein